MNPIIREATLDDAVEITALTLRSVQIVNAPDYPPAVIGKICKTCTVENVTEKMMVRDVFVATNTTAIVGTISLGGDKLHSLFVDPDLLCRQIGRTLVTHIERHAIDKGLDHLQLSSSLTAQRFYERLGYQTIGVETARVFSTILMRKALN